MPVTLTGERIFAPSVGAATWMFGSGCPADGVVGLGVGGVGGTGVGVAVGDAGDVVGPPGVAVGTAAGRVEVGADGTTGVTMARVGVGVGVPTDVEAAGGVGLRNASETAVGVGTTVRVARGVAVGRFFEVLIPGSPTPPIAKPIPTPTKSVKAIMAMENACRTVSSTYFLSLVAQA